MDRYSPAVGLRLPTFIRVNFDRVQSHTTAEYAVPIALEFILFSAASLLAVEARWIAYLIYAQSGSSRMPSSIWAARCGCGS